MEIKITLTQNPKAKPDPATVPFGVAFTDHMFLMDYDSENGWHIAHQAAQCSYSGRKKT